MKQLLTILLVVFSWYGSFSQSFKYLPSTNGEIIAHTHYTLSYTEEHEQPEWVAYYLSPEMLRKVYDRKDTFRPDPAISTGSATYDDYKTAPDYDAGHLLPCRQMQFDCTAMSETFLMSNMSPQHKDFNRYQWAYLEKLERNMAFRNKGIYVVTGPVLTSSLGEIGAINKITIPAFYYKVFLKYDEDDPNSSKTIGFLLPNKGSKEPFQNLVVPIDSVEALIGIDFFPDLPDILENHLEAIVQPDNWSFSNPNLNYGYSAKAISCTETSPSNSLIVTVSNTSLININTAPQEYLESLPGIGPSKAVAIIAARPYASISDITRVKGIGTGTFNKIRHLITVQ